MKYMILFIAASFFLHLNDLIAQSIKLDKNKLEAINVYMSAEKLMGKEVIKVIKDSAVKTADAPTYVRIQGNEFKDGVIEVNVLSRLLPNAGAGARGFI